MSLELRPNCEGCNKPVSPSSSNVYICSFERTYCSKCAKAQLKGKCPGCKGTLVPRPTRGKAMLAKYPASTKNKYKAPKTAKA